jgi:hypothetical protein
MVCVVGRRYGLQGRANIRGLPSAQGKKIIAVA